MEWQEWITAKYVEWRGDEIGKKGSISAFARWLGVSQKTVNSWINEGVIPRSASTINLLVSRFGGEIYDVLGIAPAEAVELAMDNLTAALIDMIRQLTPEQKRQVLENLRQMTEEQG